MPPTVDKKKYITTIDSIQRAKYLIEDMNRDLKFVELEQKIEAEVDLGKHSEENKACFQLLLFFFFPFIFSRKCV